MCGIVGVYHFDRNRVVEGSSLRAMADRIVHRGPDDEGYYSRDNVGLGMRRLSIIDLEGGHQPIFTTDRRRVIVFNGELYNYREQAADLRRQGYDLSTASDTEVVLGLYATYGDSFLERLNGMFGFAVYDELRDKLTLVRDRVGIKPVYYYRDDEKIVFASEIKAILAYPGVVANLDMEMLPVFFRNGFIPAPRTLFQGIFKLQPGHKIEIVNGNVSIEKYWDLSFAQKHSLTESETIEQLDELIESAVSMQMVADVPLGAFLSGGLDSSGIVHLMDRQNAGSTNTYSIGFESAYSIHDESRDAAVFARDYKTNHHAITATPNVSALIPELIRALDEPLADSSFVVTYLVSELAAQTVKVILSGVGGDEIFSGYRRYLFANLDKFTGRLPAVIRDSMLPRIAQYLPADRNSRVLNQLRLAKRYLAQGGGDPIVRYARFVSVLNEEMIGELAKSQTGNGNDPLMEQMSGCDASETLDRVMYFDFKGSLPEQLLMLTDKMTMAKSIEARVPYLDHRLVEFMARTPSSMRVKGFRLRHLQKEYLKNKVPDYVLKRKKRGFGAPFGAWIRGDLSEMFNDYLSADRLVRQGIFDTAFAQSALQAHMSRKEDFTDYLLANLSFQIWYDEYIER